MVVFNILTKEQQLEDLRQRNYIMNEKKLNLLDSLFEQSEPENINKIVESINFTSDLGFTYCIDILNSYLNNFKESVNKAYEYLVLSKKNMVLSDNDIYTSADKEGNPITILDMRVSLVTALIDFKVLNELYNKFMTLEFNIRTVAFYENVKNFLIAFNGCIEKYVISSAEMIEIYKLPVADCNCKEVI